MISIILTLFDLSLMLWLAVFNIIYLSSCLVVSSVPSLWLDLLGTKVFTRLITILLPTAHIGFNGE